MPPIIIADSDDEDNDYAQPPNPQGDSLFAGAGPNSVNLLGGVSHSTSTDPSFFQNVYDEQNYATQENFNREYPGCSAPGNGFSSSEMTAPAPFQRMVTGLAHPSSLTSVPDPTNPADPRGSSGKGSNEWTQLSTPGRKKAPTAVMDDPWDVPSSPEAGMSRAVPKMRLKQPALREARNQTAVPVDMFDLDGNGGPNGQASPERKRRRVESSYPTQRSVDEVDLVTLPFSLGPGDTQTSMLPPTLPVDKDASFFISARPLTEAQRMEYQSVSLPSSEGHQDVLPPTYQEGVQVQELFSSGAATNFNTPRGDAIGFSMAPLPSITSQPIQELPKQSVQQRLPSSPDIISAIESPPKAKRKKQKSKAKRDKSPSPREHDQVGAQESLGQIAPPLENTAVHEEIVPAAQATKAKKPRGRPRKKDTELGVETPTKPLEPDVVDAEVSTKQKKKRGRPRKQDKQPEVDDSHSAATNTPKGSKQATPIAQAKPEDASPAQYNTIDNKERAVSDEIDHTPVSKSTKEEAKQKVAVLKEASPNPVVQAADETPQKDTKSKSPDAAASEVEEKPTTPVPNSAMKSRGLSELSAMSKPMYRVGLSKRSRIAPLLKSLRK